MNPFDHAVDQVLRQPKYGILTGRIFDLKEAAGRLITDFIMRLLDMLDIPVDMNRMSRYGRILGILFIILLAVSAIFLISVLISRFLRRKQTKRQILSELYDGVDENLTYADLLKQSECFAREGNEREAVRYRFIALLSVLDNSQILSAHRSKTNGQLLRDMQNNAPGYYNAFRQAVNLFQLSWFGHRSIAGDGFNEYRNHTDFIISEAQRHE